MPKIYFSQNPNVQAVQNFYDYVQHAEKSYDQDKIIEWIDAHLDEIGDKKSWLLTGQGYKNSYEDWEKWLIDNDYKIVIDCRGWGQVLLGDTKFHHRNLKVKLEAKGITVYSLNKD
ncbi:hypothetical protein [Streptococcus merionis]|uniref:hypothetical protein n=1 Tax=Streptococcus merionis TaxID=400065 RepID=UPI0026E99CA1|nr:hypothetical protein [Streptococcus merionis]